MGASNLATEPKPETGVERVSVKEYIATGGYTSRLIYLQTACWSSWSHYSQLHIAVYFFHAVGHLNSR